MLSNKRADEPAALWSSAWGTATGTTFSVWPRLPMRRCSTAVMERAGALSLARAGSGGLSEARMLQGVVLPDRHAPVARPVGFRPA
jgi:hypothetical protein